MIIICITSKGAYGMLYDKLTCLYISCNGERERKKSRINHWFKTFDEDEIRTHAGRAQ